MREYVEAAVLTRDVGALVKAFEDLWVHGNR